MTKTDHKRRLPAALAALMLAAAVLAVFGCEGKEKGFVAPPPPKVTVQKPVQREITIYKNYTGVTKAHEAVDIRARVEGFLKSIDFTPSTLVKKGQLLFTIDPKPFQAKLDQALADLATNKAELQQAQATLIRKERAYKDRAVSEVEVIQARAEAAKAEAGIQSAKAEVETARINLSYTEIHSPIEGIISRNQVDVGNLVGSGQSTLLTSVVDVTPIYAYFHIPETDYINYKEMEKQGKAPKPFEDMNSVYLGVGTGSDYPHKGKLDFFDPRVDPDTGTIEVRGVFDNPNLELLPGMFARVRVPVGKVKDALLVPDSALGADQRGRFVLVVNDKNEVEYRLVEPGPLEGDMRAIMKGLKAGERVIVKGVQRVRAGSKATPVEADQKQAAGAGGKQPAKATEAQKSQKAKP